MKKLFTLLFCTVFCFGAYAQTIPNAGFENWTNFGFYEDPTNWATFNQTTALFGVRFVTKTTDKRSGNYAISLETKRITVPIDTTAPGFASLGSSNTDFGIPFTSRPQQLNGYYKYAPAGTDTCYVVVTLSKWNPTTQMRDFIANGVFFSNSTVSNYTQFTANLMYFSPATPDTLEILLLSSGFNGKAGSILKIDDLSFSGSVAGTGKDLATAPAFTVYPNPAAAIVNISWAEAPAQDAKLTLTDLTGRTVKVFQTGQYSSNNLRIDVSDVARGIYMLRLEQPGSLPYMQKIILSR